MFIAHGKTTWKQSELPKRLFFDYGFLARRNKYIHNESGNKSKYNLIIFQAGQNRTYIQKQFSA